MTRQLNRVQSAVLGLVVLLCIAAGAWGMVRVGAKSSSLRDGFEVTIIAPDAHDVEKGTPVRVRGIEAGQVIGVEDDGTNVRIRVRLDGKYRDRLHADATAAVASRGLMGVSVVDVRPGSSSAGPLDGDIKAQSTPDLAEVTAKLNSAAGRIDTLLQDVQSGNGTLPKLLRDDGIYNELKQATTDTRKLVNNLDRTVTDMRGDAQRTLGKVDNSVDAIHGELGELKTLVRTGKEAASAIKQDAEAIKSLPIVRSYVEDHTAILVRPDFDKDRVVYGPEHFFESNTSFLTDEGRARLDECAAWLNGQRIKGSEVVIAALVDPKSTDHTGESARALSKKQAETIAEYLKSKEVNKLSYFGRRNVTPIGLGQNPSPVMEKDPISSTRIEVILFVPRQ